MNVPHLGNSLFAPYIVCIELIYPNETYEWSINENVNAPLFCYSDNNGFHYIPVINVINHPDNLAFMYLCKGGECGGFGFTNKEVSGLKYYPEGYYSTEPNGVGVRFMILDESGYRIIEKEQSDKYINQFKEALK